MQEKNDKPIRSEALKTAQAKYAKKTGYAKQKEYMKENIRQISIPVKKEVKERYFEECKKRDIVPTAYLRRVVNEFIDGRDFFDD